MKVKIKDLTEEQINKICASTSLEHCCTPVCPLSEVDGQCACPDQCVVYASPQFLEKEIEVDL